MFHFWFVLFSLLGSSWGDWNLYKSGWIGPGFRSCRGLALSPKRKLNQPAKVRDEQMMAATQALVTDNDNTFAGATPLGSKVNG